MRFEDMTIHILCLSCFILFYAVAGLCLADCMKKGAYSGQEKLKPMVLSEVCTISSGLILWNETVNHFQSITVNKHYEIAQLTQYFQTMLHISLRTGSPLLHIRQDHVSVLPTRIIYNAKEWSSYNTFTKFIK